MGQTKPVLQAKMKCVLILVLLIGISANLAVPVDEGEADAVQVDAGQEDRETEPELVTWLREMLGEGKNSCNDQGCCSCSRQDSDGNARMIGGKCRVKKPRRKYNRCKRGSYCKCSASRIMRWCTGKCVEE